MGRSLVLLVGLCLVGSVALAQPNYVGPQSDSTKGRPSKTWPDVARKP